MRDFQRCKLVSSGPESFRVSYHGNEATDWPLTHCSFSWEHLEAVMLCNEWPFAEVDGKLYSREQIQYKAERKSKILNTQNACPLPYTV